MAPSKNLVPNGESDVPISIEKNGIGQPDKSKDVNFFDDVHFLGDKEGKVIVRITLIQHLFETSTNGI